MNSQQNTHKFDVDKMQRITRKLLQHTGQMSLKEFSQWFDRYLDDENRTKYTK